MDRPQGSFAGMFSSAIVTQALLSAANLLVSLILIRRATDAEYGYFVLIVNSLLLLTSLQGAFMQPPMVIRITRLDAQGRAALIGGLAYAQRRLLWMLALLSAGLVTIGVLTTAVPAPLLLILSAALAAAIVALFREFFRMVLLAYRRPTDVLKADFLYVVILVSGVYAATYTKLPAVIATLMLAIAAAGGSWLLARALQAHEPWQSRHMPGILRSIAPMGAWSAGGAVTHWAFSQGYNYVAVGALDVTAVAALAATRLTMMPINLMSAGIGSLMMPTASAWLKQHGAAAVLQRLLRVAGALAVATVVYFAALWTLQDWIFNGIMGKDFAFREELLMAWAAVFFVAVFRDQLLYLPGASGRFRALAIITLGSALISLTLTYIGLETIGVIGAPLGVLAGELVNLAGIIALSLREIRNERMATAVAT